MNINNSSALILCAVGAVTNLSLASMSIESIVKTNSSTRKKISLSADSYIVTYTVQLVPNAYNYSSPSAAYNSIASSIHSNVQDGQFTKILNTLSSETTHAFDAPASSNYVNVNSVLASNVPTVVPTGDSGSSLDTRTRGANSDASFVLIIAIVVTVVGLCLLMGACYIYVRRFHFKSQARKLSALQQTSLRGMGAISPQGEIIPDYGDIVDPEIIQAPDEGDNRRASMPGILDGSAPSDTGRIGSLRFPHRFIL